MLIAAANIVNILIVTRLHHLSANISCHAYMVQERRFLKALIGFRGRGIPYLDSFDRRALAFGDPRAPLSGILQRIVNRKPFRYRRGQQGGIGRDKEGRRHAAPLHQALHGQRTGQLYRVVGP